MKKIVALGVMLSFLFLGVGVWAADKIDINTATQQQLEALPGIGPALAGKIIEYRQAKPFTSIEQIKDVKGIGEAKFQQIKDLITVGETKPQTTDSTVKPADGAAKQQ